MYSFWESKQKSSQNIEEDTAEEHKVSLPTLAKDKIYIFSLWLSVA